MEYILQYLGNLKFSGLVKSACGFSEHFVLGLTIHFITFEQILFLFEFNPQNAKVLISLFAYKNMVYLLFFFTRNNQLFSPSF